MRTHIKKTRRSAARPGADPRSRAFPSKRGPGKPNIRVHYGCDALEVEFFKEKVQVIVEDDRVSVTCFRKRHGHAYTSYGDSLIETTRSNAPTEALLKQRFLEAFQNANTHAIHNNFKPLPDAILEKINKVCIPKVYKFRGYLKKRQEKLDLINIRSLLNQTRRYKVPLATLLEEIELFRIKLVVKM